MTTYPATTTHDSLVCVLSDYRCDNGQSPVTVPNEAEFLRLANGAAKKRLLDAGDYTAFLAACVKAADAALAGEPCYLEDDAGGVANSYGSTTTTAQWGVWSTPKQTIEIRVDRRSVGGRSVPKAFAGGERSYQKWFREQAAKA